MKQPKFIYDEESNESLCILTDNDNIFVGTASLHPDDADFASEKVGLGIAHLRASIKALQHYRNNELKPKLKALKQLYYSMNKSKKFNEKSYENIMLQRQIRLYQFDLDVTKLQLAELKQKLRKRIEAQEKMLNILKQNRENHKEDKSDQ